MIIRTSSIALLLALGCLVSSCGSSTEPGPSAEKRHPEGTIAGTVTVGARPFGIALSGTTALVTQLDGGQIVRVDVAERTVLDSIVVGSVPTSVTYLPGGSSAAVANQFSQSIGFVDLASHQQVLEIGAPSTTFRVMVAPDSSRLYGTASSGEVGVIALPSRSILPSYGVPVAPNGIAASADGSRLYVSTMSGSVVIVDTHTNATLATTDIPGVLQDVAVSSDGQELYVANESDGSVRVLAAASGTPTQTIALGSSAFGLAITPDGKQLYVTSPFGGLVWIIDRASRSIVRTLAVGGIPRRIAFDQTGTRAVISNEAGFVTVVE